MTQARRARGVAGEDVAAAWYASQGYEVLARNWRCRNGELDLILRRGAEVVFCEVKSRATAAFGTPQEAVTHDKRQRIRHLAARWIEDSRIRPAQIRFDVAAVLDDQLEVIEGAF
jgi:putative endonuclease